MATIMIDMDDTLCEYTKAMNEKKAEYPLVSYPQSLYGFLTDLEEVPDAVASVKLLDESHNIWFLTAPSYHNPISYTEKRVWIEKHLGFEFTKRLIICYDKSLVKGDYLIDDHNYGKGQDRFDGILIHFRSSDWPDWKSIMNYFGGVK